MVNFMDEGNAKWTASSLVWQGYMYKIRVTLHDNLHRESHKIYGPPTSVTWLQLLCTPANTSASTALTAEKHRSTRTRLRALSRNVTSF